MKQKRTSNLAPKELCLDGIIFRSQTEFRCAAFFKHMKISYEYEPQQFNLPSGFIYKPDFFLPEFGAWLEVKPNNADIRDVERFKIDEFAIAYPQNRVWLSYGNPKEYHAWLEQLETDKFRKVEHAFIVSDKTHHRTRWIISADRKYAELLSDKSQQYSQPNLPENDPQSLMATRFAENIKEGDSPSLTSLTERTIEKSKFAKKE